MSIRCVVVTPERTELDREADYISLPLYDGELGVMSGRAPLIGRLGCGTLRLNTVAGSEKYFIDGGFAQVENNVVSILTGKAIPVDLINSDQARQELEAAQAMPGSTPAESALKEAALQKARGKVRASR
jgi:F-type H+-transporting ATPase subunit epsilon